MVNNFDFKLMYLVIKICQQYQRVELFPQLATNKGSLAGIMNMAGNHQIFRIYSINNNTCVALRLHKCMNDPLGPPKNPCSLWLQKIPFCLMVKRIDFPPILSSVIIGIQKTVAIGSGFHWNLRFSEPSGLHQQETMAPSGCK